ncbi:transporter subunit membrane component of ABC superfamily [Liquorilactobacillus ghanensis DSM 18630]|jgi:polar amino acid transport system permease protein|uniref:Transporter subunit membrane component of ABC superfamily n=1 Tax=Liquorilactobacillus ghanensis DSM 18630 TaxID=1423750 RepID=A0A0R1VNZ8_9LACO|nr:amino acid ABC transporter permease [Liquorilactobacillus ghanensis]KRM07117.1 transporter subunit membrane component of ABC superfamily [Liquorilactobacillus ghanensis DSM 18630]
MNLQFTLSKLPTMLTASLMTIELTVLSLIFGTILAVIIAFMRISKNKLIKNIARFYLWIFRGTPLILQLFFLYYALPTWGITLSPFAAAVIGLSLNSAAYTAEIVRGGIISIHEGQYEAANVLGMTYRQTMFEIILPQTIRNILPAMGNQFIGMLKDTSLVSTIAMVELMRQAQLVGSATFKYTEVYITAALIYLLLTSVFSYVFSKMESKLSIY